MAGAPKLNRDGSVTVFDAAGRPILLNAGPVWEAIKAGLEKARDAQPSFASKLMTTISEELPKAGRKVGQAMYDASPPNLLLEHGGALIPDAIEMPLKAEKRMSELDLERTPDGFTASPSFREEYNPAGGRGGKERDRSWLEGYHSKK